jgi:hypothetical protein
MPCPQRRSEVCLTGYALRQLETAHLGGACALESFLEATARQLSSR